MPVGLATSSLLLLPMLQTSTTNSQKHPPVQGCPQNWLGNVQSCRNKEGFEWREFTANSGSLPSSLVMKYNQRYAPEVLIADWLGRPLHLHRACSLDASGTTTLSRMLSTREILLVKLGYTWKQTLIEAKHTVMDASTLPRSVCSPRGQPNESHGI
ncbi:hypothetical protein ACTXT7_003751 [Hymenolepis weldensis]